MDKEYKIARQECTNPFCLQVCFLAGRLDLVCAFCPYGLPYAIPPPA
jgi:hypothetical protein